MKTIQAGKNAPHALSVAILLAACASPVFAMAPPMMSVQVSQSSAVTGLGATTRDGVGVNLSTHYSERSELQSGTSKVANPNNEKTQSQQTTLLLDYRIADGLTGILAVPYVNNTSSYDNGAAGRVTQTTKGLGDIAVYGKYSFYKIDEAHEFLGLAGLKLPTASINKGDASGVFPITQQAGSGSRDFIIGGAVSWGMLYGDASYKINSKAETYQFGNFLALNAGVNYAIPSKAQFSLVGEINAESAARDKSDLAGPGVLANGEVRDTGADKIYFTSGVQWRPAKDWSLDFKAQVPLYQSIQGTQLASKTNYNVGVSYHFGGSDSAMTHKDMGMEHKEMEMKKGM
jgi:Putative MetA-pathway of phenol degradation